MASEIFIIITILLILMALGLSYAIGANDETISPLVGANVLKFKIALIIGGAATAIGLIFLSQDVAKVIGAEILGPGIKYSVFMLLAVLLSCIIWLIIGSHYDSRFVADQDPNPAYRTQPVMGANDGASSVAILVELARVIPEKINNQIWLVFFDDEDNGSESGAGWGIGSDYFVSQLKGKPDEIVILDMVGDKDLNLYMEINSNPELNNEIWGVAKQLGYSQFIDSYKYSLIDDHTPFIEAGIPAADIIDFDYPYWHTTQDTLDKISANSLKIVGETILSWLGEYTK